MNPLNKKIDEKRILDAREMAEIYHVPLNEFWRQISVASKTLFKREILLNFQSGNEKMSRWVYDVDIDSDNKTITFMFHHEVLERLHDFENNFTQYQLENIVKMGSAYSIRFYEWSLSYLKASNKEAATYRKTVEQLKETLDLGDKYKQLGDFKKRVLDAAKEEINKLTDVKFSYTIERSGHRIKYIEFTARKNKRHKEDYETLPKLETQQEPKPEALPAQQETRHDYDDLPDFLNGEEQPPIAEEEAPVFQSIEKSHEEYNKFNYQAQKQATREETNMPTYTQPQKSNETPIYYPNFNILTHKEDQKEYERKLEEVRNKKRGVELEYQRDIETCNDPDAITRYVQKRVLPPNRTLKFCQPKGHKSIKESQKLIAEARARRTYLRRQQ